MEIGILLLEQEDYPDNSDCSAELASEHRVSEYGREDPEALIHNYFVKTCLK